MKSLTGSYGRFAFDYVKASPTELAYCSWGVGSGGHLAMEVLKARTGIKLRHVPYKTATQCSNDLAAGHVQIGFADSVSALPHLKSGRIRAVAVSGPERLLPLPDVPTMSEQGVKFDYASWLAVFGPRNLRASIVSRLNAEISKIIASPTERASRPSTYGPARRPSPKTLAGWCATTLPPGAKPSRSPG